MNTEIGNGFARRTTELIEKKINEAKRGRKPKWAKADKEGVPDNVSENVEALLEWIGVKLRRNLMNHSTEWSGDVCASIPISCMNAVMYANVIDAGQHAGFTKTQHLQAYLDKIEAKNAYHPVVDWAKSRPWDGVDRIPDLVATLDIRGDEWARYGAVFQAMVRCWLISGGLALASDRGVAAQGVLVLQGAQGAGKTRWIKGLTAPRGEFVRESLILDPSDRDSVAAATSSFIVELGELDATYRKSDVAALKGFLTKDVDNYRSPYAKKAESYPRRTIFAATVNPEQFLADDTGNRRFWVIPVGKCHPTSGLDMQQVWAQAIALAQQGEPHWLNEEAFIESTTMAQRFEMTDPIKELFLERFDMPSLDDLSRPSPITLQRIKAILRPEREWSLPEAKQLSSWLKKHATQTKYRGQVAFYIREKPVEL